MRGAPSLPIRLARMEHHQEAIDLDAQIQFLAEEYGLDPDEIRAELAAHQERIARYGREPIDVTIRRVAAEYGLDDAELRAEYEQIQHRLRSRGCAR